MSEFTHSDRRAADTRLDRKPGSHSRGNPWTSTACFLIGTLTLGAGLFARAGDVSFYGVAKSRQFRQTTNTSPTLLASNAHLFDAFVLPSTNFAVTSATVTPPNTTPLRTLALETNGSALRFQKAFNTQAELDAAYPHSGMSAYAMTMSGVHDGTQNSSVSYFLFGYPPTPQVLNLMAAQRIDATADFALEWSLPGGSDVQLMQLVIVDSSSNVVFSSPALFEANPLNGASTNILIPARTLPPGMNLVGHLSIAQPALPNTNTIPGAVGIALLAKETSFPLVTCPPALRPRLEVASTNAAPFRVRFIGEPNQNYHIQTSADLRSWQDLLVTNSATGLGTIPDAQSGSLARRFYRIQVGP